MTGNSEDFIESNKIIEWININNIGISMTKMGMELNKYCIINHIDGVHKHFKKIDGKKKNIWIGIKNRFETK